MSGDRREVLRIATSLSVVCALAGVVLGGAYVATHRYREAADRRAERLAILEMLQLDSSATVTEVKQFLAPERGVVVYRAARMGEAADRQATFALDGRLVEAGPVAPAAAGAGSGAAERGLIPLGRIFAARQGGRDAGFVIEGETRGYKNRIRFFVALDPALEIAGVRVVEHEEDPGLGAEVATPAFTGQYLGRAADQLGTLDVTRDPLPEDWRAALARLSRGGVAAWRARYAGLIARERTRPVYAVTGATISSRALTSGVRETVDHFRRRWALVAPVLGAAS